MPNLRYDGTKNGNNKKKYKEKNKKTNSLAIRNTYNCILMQDSATLILVEELSIFVESLDRSNHLESEKSGVKLHRICLRIYKKVTFVKNLKKKKELVSAILLICE